MLKSVALALFAGVLSHAQTPVTVRVSSETAPPGGMAQVKVLLTSPQPITGGGMSFAGALSVADGISLFSPTGDVFGVGVQRGGNIDVRFVSPGGTFGTNVDYPIMTVTFGVPATAAPGESTAVSLGSSSWWQGVTGSAALTELKPGAVTVGGSVSISDVIPGGGALAAGAVFSIYGTGFSPATQVQLRGLKASSIACVSDGEIRVTVKETAVLDGVAIQVNNPDGSSDTYYSYLRGIPAGASSNPLIASAVPIFSSQTAGAATLGPIVLPQFSSPYAIGLALQNPGSSSANVRLEVLSGTGTSLRSARLSLEPRRKISRELSEWLGPIPSGASVHVVSDQPLQSLGLLVNTSDGSVLPIGLVAR